MFSVLTKDTLPTRWDDLFRLAERRARDWANAECAEDRDGIREMMEADSVFALLMAAALQQYEAGLDAHTREQVRSVAMSLWKFRKEQQ